MPPPLLFLRFVPVPGPDVQFVYSHNKKDQNYPACAAQQYLAHMIEAKLEAGVSFPDTLGR